MKILGLTTVIAVLTSTLCAVAASSFDVKGGLGEIAADSTGIVISGATFTGGSLSGYSFNNTSMTGDTGFPGSVIYSTGGGLFSGALGSHGGISRSDTQIELQNVPGSGLLAGISIYNRNPTTNEASIVWDSITSTSQIVEVGSDNILWSGGSNNNTTGFSTRCISVNTQLTGGGTTENTDICAHGNLSVSMLSGASGSPSQFVVPPANWVRDYGNFAVTGGCAKFGALVNFSCQSGMVAEFQGGEVRVGPTDGAGAIEFGYSNGGATAFIEGVNRTSGVVRTPVQLNGTEVTFGTGSSAANALTLDSSQNAKFTGDVWFDNYSTAALTQVGYILARDAAGNVRKLMVGN